MGGISRRRFLSRTGKGLARAALGGLAMSAKSHGRVQGANERVRLGLIGCGGRGRSLIQGLIKHGAEVPYVCDVNRTRFAGAVGDIEKLQGYAPATRIEMREVFEDRKVDAVVAALPEHWHALAAVWACQAGKDVYVEKCHTLAVLEGRKVIEAAGKYGRVVQVGTQNRSAPYAFLARDYIQGGGLGRVVHVKVFNMLGGGPWSPQPDQPVPEGLDWDRWLGPAREVPYNPGRHSMGAGRGWSHHWDYCGGPLSDDASHCLDLARLAIGDPGHPKSVYCAGGRLAFDDARETPDLQAVTYDFGAFTMTCESANFPPYMKKSQPDVRYGDKFPDWRQNATRIEIYGTKRMMYLGRHGGGWQVLEGDGNVVDFEYGYFPDQWHQQNFIESVRSRKQPNGNVEQAHLSACLVHLGNLSLRVGCQQLYFDGEKETFKNNEEANALLRPHYRKHYRIPDEV